MFQIYIFPFSSRSQTEINLIFSHIQNCSFALLKKTKFLLWKISHTETHKSREYSIRYPMYLLAGFKIIQSAQILIHHI